ncbi:MAG TPA: hypothetical protein VGR06_34330 [Actinophytocola sp.]|jgi:hypothetical protein|uniref:hypothetical protein n=1 Tax=Actinophytocola sp. TaxID=1872138 RepID=UPI002E00CEEB|nr:hypothetical protein [Actinophytocola sp.]
MIEDEVFAVPGDFLGNAAFAQVMIGHLQAVVLRQLADFTRAHEGDEFAYLEVATLLHISGRAKTVLTIHHTADEIAAMHAAIVVRARELKDAGGEIRALAQLEADVARDLLLSTRPPGWPRSSSACPPPAPW